MKNIEKKDQITATRHTLSEEWKSMRQKVDWMAAPGMADYVNGMVSGKALNNNGHWALYALARHIEPLFQKRSNELGLFRTKPKLSMLSLGCGSCHIEAGLFAEFNWPITRFVGAEYDQHLRDHAAQCFSKRFPNIDAELTFFDFNKPHDFSEKFDIVFTCHAIHHATDLEAFLPAINSHLKPDGIIIGIDFFGPTRFQVEHDVQVVIRELFDLLPQHLRRDLRSPEGTVFEKYEVDSIEVVRKADISESVRSSDLRTLLFSNFPVLDIKPMGGTLLRWLLQYRAGNFMDSNPDHVAICRLLQIIEREMIASRKIRSDDLFFVLGKSNRL